MNKVDKKMLRNFLKSERILLFDGNHYKFLIIDMWIYAL